MQQGVATVRDVLALAQGSLPAASATAWIVGVALLGVVALLFALVIASRRQERRHLRQIVWALEDLRAGNVGRRAEVDPQSPVSFVADAVNRLGEDLASRGRAAQGADERLGALLHAARDLALVMTDTDGDVRGFSVSATEMFGWEEDEVLSRPASILFDERSWKDLLPRLSRRSFRERGIEARARLVRKDGTPFEGQISVRMVPATTGESSGFLLLVKDVSAEVRLEEELRESEARYRALFEGLAEGVFLLQEGKIVLANPALATLCGVTVAELEGKPLRDWIATRDLMVVQERLAGLERADKGQEEMRATLLGADARPVAQVRIRASAVTFGARPAVLGSLRDETAERLVESELRRNESRLDAVLEATSDGILMVADSPAGGVVRMTNQAFLRLFSLGEREVLGASEGDLLRGLRERGEGAETVAAFLAATTRGTRIERVALGGDRPRVLELRGTVLVSGDGIVLGRVLACRDITDQKAFEQRLETNAEALRKSKADLEESYARLQAVQAEVARHALDGERLNRELKTLNEMKSNLLANVSHELQTPLVSIRGYTEMILRERLGSINEEQRKGLALSLKNIDRLISMIDNLLAFTRAPQEATELKLETFPLRPLVEESMEMLREKARGRRIELIASFAEPEVAVEADRDKILQVFLNLLGNAVKFNREGGRVEVAVGPGKPGFVDVQVKDTGIGIPADEIERIFDRYYRTRAAADEEGSGIGLSLVRTLLRLHGCSIRAESEEGRGSTFSFTLPAARSQHRGESRKPDDSGKGARRDPRMAAAVPEPARPPEPQAPPSPPHPPAPDVRPRFRIIRNPRAKE